MSPYELFELICKEFTDKQDLVNITNDTISNIGQCKYTYELEELLEEWCVERDICPMCSETLVTLEEYEEASEYWGAPATEKFTVIGCENSNCPYVIQ